MDSRKAQKRKADEDSTSLPSSHQKLIKIREEQTPVYSSISMKMMSKMGHKSGEGLGRANQGRIAPVVAAQTRGRVGLGSMVHDALKPAEVIWDSSMEVIEIEQSITWMEPCKEEIPQMEVLKSWIVHGERKETIDDETKYCDPEVLSEVLACKSVLDSLDGKDLFDARSRSNPFETIKKVFFQNRAAVKMAEMDAVCGFMFTNPLQPDGRSLVEAGEPLYFADVCAGPGGFSEYVLWRKKWQAKGFGFTLRGENDFKLDEFLAGPPECFEPHYGRYDDGDVYNPENITTFRDFVLGNTSGRGIHFMMADGGFSVEGQENLQEVLSKRLYLCQFLVALYIVRTGGHFTCKLFDVFTPFSAGLLYLMWLSFRRIAIFKPNSSRPANSERYIICEGKREGADVIADYMYQVNLLLEEAAGSEEDVCHIVPESLIMNNKQFFEYLVESNNVLGRRQIVGLTKIVAFVRDRTLSEQRQGEIKRQCLDFWNLKEEIRRKPQRDSAKATASSLLRTDPLGLELLSYDENELTEANISNSIRSVYDWRCVVVGGAPEKCERSYYLSTGRTEVYRYDSGSWTRPFGSGGNIALELPAESLIYAELIYEYRGHSKGQRKAPVLYIIDALVLGGEFVGDRHLNERHDLCCKFAKAVNKSSRPDLVPVKAKDLYKLEQAAELFKRLDQRYMKGNSSGSKTVYCLDDSRERFIAPTGLLLLKGTREPWMMSFSKSQKRQYFFHTLSRKSDYSTPPGSKQPFSECMKQRLVWWWNESVQLSSEREPPVNGKLHRLAFEEFISKSAS